MHRFYTSSQKKRMSRYHKGIVDFNGEREMTEALATPLQLVFQYNWVWVGYSHQFNVYAFLYLVT